MPKRADAQLELVAHRAGTASWPAAHKADDLPRIIAMLNNVLWTMDRTSDGWRRYVTLMLDAITTTAPRPLQSTVPLRLPSHTGSWPL